MKTALHNCLILNKKILLNVPNRTIPRIFGSTRIFIFSIKIAENHKGGYNRVC
jgi:hypothetical protein